MECYSDFWAGVGVEYHSDFSRSTNALQNCKRCTRPSNPKFDVEATLRAMNIVIKRIKRIYYGILPEINDHEESSKHSKAQERRTEHDSKNCEACKAGKCSFNEDFSGVRNRRHHANIQSINIPKTIPMSWTLHYNGKVCPGITI